MPEKLKNETQKILLLLATSELAHSFLYVTYTVFLLARGVTLMQVSLLCMICGIAAVLFDIPTGAFADVVGRKKAYMLSCFVWILCSATYVLSHSFLGYAIAEILAALGMSLANGTVSAHLWDTVTGVGSEMGLAESEIEEHNKSLSAKVIWVTSPVSAIGGFVGAKLLDINPAIPWIGTGIGMLITLVMASRVLKETKVRKDVSFGEDVKEMTGNTLKAFKILFKEGEIRQVAIFRLLLRITSVPIFLYWTPFLKEAGASVIVLGLAWILMEIAMSLGVYLCRKLPERFDAESVMTSFMIIFGLSAVFGAITNTFVTVLVAILVIEAANMALAYLFGNFTQKKITELGYGEAGGENNMRATVLSSVSTSISIGGIVGELSAGYSVTKLGIANSWFLSGILLVSISAVFLARYLLRQRKLAPALERAV